MAFSGTPVTVLSSFINGFINFNVLFSHCITPDPTLNNFKLMDNLNKILQRINNIPFYVSVMTKNNTKMCNLTLPNNYELANRLTFGQAVFIFHLQNITYSFWDIIYKQIHYKLGFSLQFTFHLLVTTSSKKPAITSEYILKNFRTSFGFHLLLPKYERNNVLVIVLAKFGTEHKILNLYYVFLKCKPTSGILELRSLSLWAIIDELENFKYNELPYKFSIRFKPGGFGSALSPYNKPVLPSLILFDKDDHFKFKIIVITLLVDAWTQNRTYEYSARQCYHNSDPRLVSDLSQHEENSYRIVTAEESFNLVTCHGVLTNLSSDTEFIVKYGKPFDKVVWLTIGIGIIVISCFSGCVLFIFKRLPLKDVCIIIFESIVFAFVFQYPRTKDGMIRKQMYFYYCNLFGSILLSLIVLINTYMSLVISEVIAPTKVKVAFETLQQLTNASIVFLDPSDRNMSKDTIRFGTYDELDMLEDKVEEVPDFMRAALRYILPEEINLEMFIGDCPQSILISKVSGNDLSQLTPYCLTVYKFLRQVIITQHNIEYVGSKMVESNCKKPFFIGTKNSEASLNLETLKSNFPEVFFYKGMSKYFSHQVGVMISEIGISGGKMIKLFQNLFTSGIYQELYQLKELRKIWNLERSGAKVSEKRDQTITSDSIGYVHFEQTCLSISCLISISVVLFIIEMFKAKEVKVFNLT